MARISAQQLKERTDSLEDCIRDIQKDVTLIKTNHLAHMAQDIDELKGEVKETRSFFQQRLDRLDSRLWAIVVMTLGSLVGVLIQTFLQ